MSKVRIYDLAQELKPENRKVLENARRMGVDLSMPSNTLDDNIAAKIREMYYPDEVVKGAGAGASGDEEAVEEKAESVEAVDEEKEENEEEENEGNKEN